MSRTVTRKFCDRDMGAHELATVYVEDDGRVVKVREAQATKNGMTPMWRPYTEADLADFAGMTVTAMCPCGNLYDLDIAALMRGKDTRPRRARPESHTGVPYDRRRHNG
jgi:hypothetical protein